MTLAQGHLHMKINAAFLSNHWAIFSQILNVSLYSFVVYLYVNGSGSITSVGEERANLSAVVYL